VVLSDAACEPGTDGRPDFAGAGWIVLVPKGGIFACPTVFYAAAAVPDSVHEWSRSLWPGPKPKVQFIGVDEAVALASPYYAPGMAEVFRHRDVIHCGDNNGVNQAAKKGVCKARDVSLVLGALQLRWAALGVRPWVYYVNTHANWADDPSRRLTSGLRSRGAVRVPFAAPPLPSSTVEPRHAEASLAVFPPFGSEF